MKLWSIRKNTGFHSLSHNFKTVKILYQPIVAFNVCHSRTRWTVRAPLYEPVKDLFLAFGFDEHGSIGFIANVTFNPKTFGDFFCRRPEEDALNFSGDAYGNVFLHATKGWA